MCICASLDRSRFDSCPHFSLRFSLDARTPPTGAVSHMLREHLSVCAHCSCVRMPREDPRPQENNPFRSRRVFVNESMKGMPTNGKQDNINPL